MNTQEPLVLIILGTHRSGTSMVAKVAHESGIRLGPKLLPPNAHNPGGYFEDTEFIHLHDDILGYHGFDHEIEELDHISVPREFDNRANALIGDRQELACWGWKDPRTCLFLDYWSQKIPNAKYLIVLRHFGAVVRSFMARYYYNVHRTRMPILPAKLFEALMNARTWRVNHHANRALNLWKHHNRLILEKVIKKNKEFCVVDYDAVIDNESVVVDGLRSLGFHTSPPAQIPSTRVGYHFNCRYNLQEKSVREAQELYEEIHRSAEMGAE